MKTHYVALAILAVLFAAVGGYIVLHKTAQAPAPSFSIAGVPTAPSDTSEAPVEGATLSGTYVCLPHRDTTGPQTEECAFGFKTDAGLYYALNFGASAGAMDQFRSGAHVTAQGFVQNKDAIDPGVWERYDIEGLFTITALPQPHQ